MSYYITDEDARILRQMLAWEQSFSGPGASNSPGGGSIGMPPVATGSGDGLPFQICAKVTVTAASSRPGVYLGYRRRGVKQRFDPSGNGRLNANSVNEFGELPPNQQEIYILNGDEEGSDTHELTEGGARLSRTHVACFDGYATDGKPVWFINGSTMKVCS